MSTVGIVGLGAMGSRIAARLLDVGHQVHATNRTCAKARSLVERGLRWHDTPRAVAAAADVVLSMVRPSAIAVDGVLAAADGLGYGHRDIAALREMLVRLSPLPVPDREKAVTTR